MIATALVSVLRLATIHTESQEMSLYFLKQIKGLVAHTSAAAKDDRRRYVLSTLSKMVLFLLVNHHLNLGLPEGIEPSDHVSLI